ncbi:MAG: GNAT family N-acetyltransferase [Roseovarius sp.]
MIRAYVESDCEALAGIYSRTVARRAVADYTGPQIEAWLSIAPTSQRIAEFYSDGRLALVAVDNRGRPIGFSDMEADGHIQFLYVDPAATGRGVGARLLAEIEAAARQSELARLYSESSETALSVFLKAGFTSLQRRNLVVAGTGIHNYAVEKRLLAEARSASG